MLYLITSKKARHTHLKRVLQVPEDVREPPVDGDIVIQESVLVAAIASVVVAAAPATAGASHGPHEGLHQHRQQPRGFGEPPHSRKGFCK